MDLTEEMKKCFESYIINNERFLDGSNEAGKRARIALSTLTKLAKARRAEIQQIKNSKSLNMRHTR